VALVRSGVLSVDDSQAFVLVYNIKRLSDAVFGFTLEVRSFGVRLVVLCQESL
jgi:hypothetical protein